MVTCSACNVVVLVTQKRIKCTSAGCSKNYHQDCVDYADSPAARSIWVCPACVAARPKGGDNTNTPVQGKSQKSVSDSKPVAVAAEPLSQACGSRGVAADNSRSRNAAFTLGDVKELLRSEMSQMRADIATVKNFIQNEFGPLKAEVKELKESVAFFDVKYDDLVKRVEGLEKKVSALGSSKAELKEVKSTIAKIDWELNTKEQWARRSNIEIQGVPETKNENLLEIFANITQLAGFPIDVNSDVDFINRVAPMTLNTKKPKAIVVRFLARYKKDDCLNRLRKLRDLKACDVGFAGSNSAIYFNDHLTKTNKLLLGETKKIATENNYKWVWVRNCCIMVRRNDSSTVMNISTNEDLKKIK